MWNALRDNPNESRDDDRDKMRADASRRLLQQYVNVYAGVLRSVTYCCLSNGYEHSEPAGQVWQHAASSLLSTRYTLAVACSYCGNMAECSLTRECEGSYPLDDLLLRDEDDGENRGIL
jgi:hypothetical protein